jgi:hypothetical protein
VVALEELEFSLDLVPIAVAVAVVAALLQAAT